MFSEPWTASRTTDSLGRSFEWLRLLGKGGFGEVYLALMRSPTGLEQHVAVKLLPAGLAPDTRSIVRLRDEARLLASLRHPVVLAPHDLAEIGGRVALVTEFVEGDDLSACIDRDDAAPLPPSALLEVIEQVASALEAAWNQLRVVHRDVKPENIRIGRHGNVKLLDFGLASSDVVDRAPRTSGDRVLGTMRYFAPERFDPRRDPTPASDVFALGCILYQGLTREPLLGDKSLPEVVQLFADAARWDRFVEQRVASIGSPEMRALLVQLLAHDDGSRPSAGDVRERCEALRARDPAAVPLSRWCRDRRWREPLHSVARAHLDRDRLASATVTDEEQAHLSSCLSCRTSRRLLLTEWTLGRYRILGRVGRGGMSDVYAAVRESDGQRCALKVLRDRRTGLERRTAREAELLRSVANAHVLPLLEVFEHDAGPVLVLPFVEGPTLAALLEVHRVPPNVASAWFAAIVDGVAALHRAGTVHRDLKPANVLLDPSSGVVVPKITDLGLARELDGGASNLTRSGMMLGTPAYTAPEQLASARSAGPRADVWSLGVRLVELFTGERVREPPPGLPAPWDALADRLLQPDPALRPTDATAVAALLPATGPVEDVWVERCRSLIPSIEPAGTDRPRETFESPLERSGSVPPVATPRRVGTATLALGVGLLGALAVIAVLWLRPTPAEAPDPVAAVVPATPVPAPAQDLSVAADPAPPPVPAPPVVRAQAPEAPPVPVWIKTRPWGHVTVGAQRWSTEDRSMRLSPGRRVLRLESHDGRYTAEVPLEVAAGRENRLCWDFPTDSPCSP